MLQPPDDNNTHRIGSPPGKPLSEDLGSDNFRLEENITIMAMLSRAHGRILALERDLETNDNAVARAVQETVKAQAEAHALTQRLRSLGQREVHLDEQPCYVDDEVRRLHSQLQQALRERDEARELVENIRGLMLDCR